MARASRTDELELGVWARGRGSGLGASRTDELEQRVLPQQRHVVGAATEPPELREAGGAHVAVGVRGALREGCVLLVSESSTRRASQCTRCAELTA